MRSSSISGSAGLITDGSSFTRRICPVPLTSALTRPPPAVPVTVTCCRSSWIFWNFDCISCACCRIFMKSRMARWENANEKICREPLFDDVEVERVDRGTKDGIAPAERIESIVAHHLIGDARRRDRGTLRILSKLNVTRIWKSLTHRRDDVGAT